MMAVRKDFLTLGNVFNKAWRLKKKQKEDGSETSGHRKQEEK